MENAQSPLRLGLIGLLLLSAASATVFGADEPPARKGNAPPLPGRIFLYDKVRTDPMNGLLGVDPNDRTCIKISDEMASFSRVRVSPDGRRAVVLRYDQAKKGSVWVIDVEGEKPPVQIFDQEGIACWAGRDQVVINKLVSRGQSRSVWRVNADGSETIKLPLPETEIVEDISPDGKWFLTRSSRSSAPGLPMTGFDQSPIYRIRADGTGERPITRAGMRLPWEPGDPEAIVNNHARFSPDGKRILYLRRKFEKRLSSSGAVLWIVDADGNNDHPLLIRIDDRPVHQAAWAPDGETIAVVMWAPLAPVEDMPAPPQLWLIDPDGKNPRNIPLADPSSLTLLDWR